MVTSVYTNVKVNQMIQLGFAHSNVCKLYINKKEVLLLVISTNNSHWLLVPVIHKLWICYDVYGEKNSLGIYFVICVYGKKYVFVLYPCFGHRGKTLRFFKAMRAIRVLFALFMLMR